MKLLLGFIYVLMAASSLQFTVSSVKYMQREKYPNYYRPYLHKPRRPYNHTILDLPQHIVDMVANVVDIEKNACETDAKKCVTRKYDAIDGIWNLYPFYNHKHVQDAISETMLPIAEKLAGERLEKVGLFGVREYHLGASMAMHYDRRETHIFGFSCLHGKDHEWPFAIQKEPGTRWDIELEPGQCIFYVAADYLHGRPSKFKGDSYMGWYLHYRPWRSEEQKRLDGERDDDVVVGGNRIGGNI